MEYSAISRFCAAIFLVITCFGAGCASQPGENPKIEEIAASDMSTSDKFHAFNREMLPVLKDACSKETDDECISVLKQFTDANKEAIEDLSAEFKGYFGSMSKAEKMSFGFSMMMQSYARDMMTTYQLLDERMQKNPELKKEVENLMKTTGGL